MHKKKLERPFVSLEIQKCTIWDVFYKHPSTFSFYYALYKKSSKTYIFPILHIKSHVCCIAIPPKKPKLGLMGLSRSGVFMGTLLNLHNQLLQPPHYGGYHRPKIILSNQTNRAPNLTYQKSSCNTNCNEDTTPSS